MKKTRFTMTSLLLAAAMLLTLGPAAFADSAVDTILTVGTTQAFSDEPVPETDVRTILQAGLASESAINQQPWYFVAITDGELMEELSGSGSMPGGGAMPSAQQGGEKPAGFPEGDAPAGFPGGELPADFAGGDRPAAPQGGAPGAMGGGSAKASLGDSPLAILVYMNENSASPNPSFDCGLAVQNMVIAAASLGYGAKVVSSPTMTLNGADHDAICEKLGVDPALKAVAVLLIGKPDTAVDGASGASTRASLEEKATVIG